MTNDVPVSKINPEMRPGYKYQIIAFTDLSLLLAKMTERAQNCRIPEKGREISLAIDTAIVDAGCAPPITKRRRGPRKKA